MSRSQDIGILANASQPHDHAGLPIQVPGMEQMDVVDPSAQFNEEDQYIHGYKLALITAALCSALTLVGLDGTILSTAVPSITNQFHTIADIAWYTSAFRLTSCGFQFVYGKLYSLYSVKSILLGAILIFELGSLLCALAPDSTSFIVGRAFCGLGQAGIYAGCFTLVRQIVPLRRRSVFNSIAAAVEGISELSGPLLGGLLTDALSWRWCFYINLPIGAVTMGAVFLFLPTLQPPAALDGLTWKQKIYKIDLLGTAVFVPSIACLILALQWAGLTYGWGSPQIIVLLVIFVILLAVFGWYQHKQGDAAVLPLRILRQRSVLASMWYMFLSSASLNIVTYYMPIYFQSVQGTSASKSGLLILPTLGGFIFACLISGMATPIVGYYSPFAICSSVLLPVASGLLTTLKVDTSLATLIGFQVLFGAACGLGYQVPQVSVQTSLSPQDAPLGISVILFVQALGPAVFNAAAQNVFTTRLTQNLEQVPGVNATALESLGLSDIRSHLTDGQLGPSASAKEIKLVLASYDKSLMDTFLLPTVMTSLMLVGAASMEWRSVKKKRS